MSKSVPDSEESFRLRDTRVIAFRSSAAQRLVTRWSPWSSAARVSEASKPDATRSPGKGALAVTIAVLLGGGHARAQDQPPTQLPEVLVTGEDDYRAPALSLQKYNGPLLTTPQSATVVTQQLMQDQGVTSLRDSLRNVSGISIGAGEGSYQGDNFSIRGFAARSDIFLDGMTDYGSYNRDPFNLEQIEVLKGPSSAEFGRGSSGGVVNQESKTPQLHPFTQGSLEYGTDNTERGTLDVNIPIPGLPGAALRLNAMGDHSNVAERNEASFERWGIAPSLAFGIGTPTRLTLSYFSQSENNVPDYGIPWLFDRPAPVDRRNYYGFNDDYLKTDVNIGTVKFEHDFDDRFSLREQFRVADYRRNFRISQADTGDIAPGTPLDQMIVGRDIIDGVSNDRLVDEDIDLTSKIDTGPVKHSLILGFEYVHQSVDPRRIEPTWANVPNTSLLNPAVDQPFTGNGTTGTEVQAMVNTGSIYLTDTAKIGEDWTLIGNVRYDHVAARYYESIAPTAEFNQDDNLFSWRAAVVYQPKPNGSIYLSSGTSVHPNIAQLDLSSEPTLPPETKYAGIGRNFEVELGTKWDVFDERFSFSTAVFLDDQTNPAPVDLDDPLLEVFNGRERVYGWEFGSVGRLTSKWKVLLNYTLQFGEVTAASDPTLIGNPVLNAPKHTASLWTTYDLPWNLEAGFGANLVSSRTASESPDPQNGLLMVAPGYIIFSAMLKYHVTKNIDIQANVTNLTDKYYYDGVHPGHINPGEGRAVFISTSFRF